MSYFQYTGERNGLSWFSATKNKVHQIAYLFQKKCISRENIITYKFSNTLDVGLYNDMGWKFTVGDKYHLMLNNLYNNKTSNIHMYYDYHGFVPSWYRASLGNVDDQTWKALNLKSFKPQSTRAEFRIGTHEQKIVSDYHDMVHEQRELANMNKPPKYEHYDDSDLIEYYAELARVEREKNKETKKSN